MIHYKNLSLDVSPDVYEPAEDSFLLADNLCVEPGSRVLDVGTGTGILALSAADKASFVLGVDVNPRAVELARKNAERNNIRNVEFRLSDLFENIRVDEGFDLIVFNPPYLPVEEEGLLEKAWCGGAEGIEVIERFVSVAKNYLLPKGKLLLLVSSLNGLDRVLDLLTSSGFTPSVVAEEKLFFEELYVVCSVSAI